jgi:hypothetical protein
MVYSSAILTRERHICWFCHTPRCTSLVYLPCVHPSDSDTHLHQVVKDISTSYDAVVDFLESIEYFVNRLDIYTRVPSTGAMTEIFVKIMVELISTLALVTKQIKQKRPSKCVLTSMLLV